MKNKNLFLTILIVVLFSAVSFIAGKNFPDRGGSQMANRGQFGNQGRNMENGQKFAGTQMRGGQILGEITAIENDKVTIKEVNGSSKVILLTEETSIVKTTVAPITDLKVGGKIAVFGKSTTDAIISAQNIQLNPLMPNASPSAQPK